MNKTAIEWCDYTWNPVTGCKHDCPYCYARKIAERFKGSKAWPQGFEPMFHKERLKDPEKDGRQHYNAFPATHPGGATIFVCSMADLFGAWVPYEWQHSVFDMCRRTPRHTYIFLTKNPLGMRDALTAWMRDHPDDARDITNWWFGVSAGDRDYSSVGHYDPICSLRRVPSKNLFVSMEPLLINYTLIDYDKIKQVIIGAQTNPEKIPPYSAVETVVNAARSAGAKVFIKDSLVPRLKDNPLFSRELAWPLRKEVPA